MKKSGTFLIIIAVLIAVSGFITSIFKPAGILNLPLFIVSSILIVMAPGPDFIYVTTRGISEGNKAGILSAAGISTGLLVHTIFAALGLSAIIQSSLYAYLIIKFLGAAYLVYLGVKAILNKTRLEINNTSQRSRKSIFREGVITNVFNPKAVITFVAFLPQFVDVKTHSSISQFIFLGILLAVIAVLWFSCVGYFAGIIGGLIKRNVFVQRMIKTFSGIVMILLGLRLALERK